MKTTNAIAMKVINFQNLIVTMMWIMLGKRQNTGVFMRKYGSRKQKMA